MIWSIHDVWSESIFWACRDTARSNIIVRRRGISIVSLSFNTRLSLTLPSFPYKAQPFHISLYFLNTFLFVILGSGLPAWPATRICNLGGRAPGTLAVGYLASSITILTLHAWQRDVIVWTHMRRSVIPSNQRPMRALVPYTQPKYLWSGIAL